LTTGLLTVATNSRIDNRSNNKSAIASLSYVTGSHILKVGYNHRWGYMNQSRPYNGDIVQLSFFAGRAISASTLNTPVAEVENLNFDDGLYVQDRWTVKRFTFNLGGRFDHFNESIPAQSAPAGRFVPARSFAAIENIPNWNDWATRTGVAYDVFANGKTAVKANLAKFVAGSSTDYTAPYNPMGQQVDSRSWTDLDGNGLPLDANGNVQFAELGPTTNTQFGLTPASTLAPDTPRGYNWEQNVSLQHELYSGISVTVGYYRRQFYNLTWTDNTLAEPQDYTLFTITGPSDPRLPNGGGGAITMYNLNPAKLGLVNNVVKVSDTRTIKYNGFEVSGTARLRGGVLVRASETTERTETYNCQVSNPNALRFCHVVPPFRTLFKTSGSFPLPYGFLASAIFQLQPAPMLGATYAVNSAIAGVPITGGGSLSVQLVQPGTLYAGYYNELDMRFMRIFKFQRTRVQGYVDFFNLTNASSLTTQIQTFGPSWLQPTAIQQARSARFGVQLDF
jgi:hypothetical protein